MIFERHRHRYEINNDYVKSLRTDWQPSGLFEEGNLVEIGELKNHPFMIGSQFQSRIFIKTHTDHIHFSWDSLKQAKIK